VEVRHPFWRRRNTNSQRSCTAHLGRGEGTRALLILDGGRARAVRIKARNAEEARRIAFRELGAAEVVLLEAAYRGEVTVFRRTEIMRAMSSSQASKDEAAQLVSPNGTLVEKALSPTDPVDNKIISDRLAGQLLYAERKLLGPKLEQYVRQLNVDWPNLTPAQLSEQFAKVRTGVRGLLGASSRDMLPTWQARTEVTVSGVVSGTKKVMQTNFLPQIATSLSQPNRQVIEQISAQQGFFMRDAAGFRSDQITAAGRRVVQDGLKQGLGRNQIADNLAKQLPQAWQKYGRNYFRTVAAVSVNRARSYGEISGYTEAGIEQLEVQAVLDERTTDICFAAGTMVLTPRGGRPIELINQGDEVITGLGMRRKVKAAMRRTTNGILELLLSSGRRIMVTENHPILMPGGWIPARELSEGDKVAGERTIHSGDGRLQMPQLRKAIPYTRDIHKTWRRKVLFARMLARASAEGKKQGVLRTGMSKVQKNIPRKTFQHRERTSVLFNRMSAKSSRCQLQHMWGNLYSIDEQKRNGEVLLNRMSRTRKRNDQCREMDSRGFNPGWLEVGKRKGNRPVFSGFHCGGIGVGHRGRRRILARQGDGGESSALRFGKTKRIRDKRSGIKADQDRRCRFEKSPRQIAADSIRVEHYIKGVSSWLEVVSVKKITGEFTVYNLSVEDDPTYIAEGVIVHNCRCLDGQIIDTNLASQQVLNAASVRQPEDIFDASPFLKEKVDQNTGTKSLVTTNNGTKIAEVTRSGYGRVDDRGQFNRTVANNQLTDHNIGPPPYHHLCRSWTVPVSSTVQVPRGQVPRAGGTTPPLPPRIVPKGGRIPPGVGPRPQVAGPNPTPTNPKPTGEPDPIERYPFTGDFTGATSLSPSHFRGTIGRNLKNAAVYQEYRFDPVTRAIRASGKDKIVPRLTREQSLAGKRPLANLSKKLILPKDVSGVRLYVERLDQFAIREVILAESSQLPARRIYSMNSVRTNTNYYLKFNGDKKRAASSYLKKLRSATTPKHIKDAIAGLEKKGYVQGTHSSKDVLFGDTKRPMKPKPAPKKPRPEKKPEKKPITSPTVQPKPKPKVHRVTPTGQLEPKPKRKPRAKPVSETPPKPSPGGAKDYSQYGLLDEKTHSLIEQVQTRAKMEAARISDALKAAEAKFPKGLSARKRKHLKARSLRDFIKADTGPVEKFTSAKVKKFQTKELGGYSKDSLEAVAQRNAAKGSMELKRGFRASQVRLKEVSSKRVAELMNDSNSFLSQRMVDAAKKNGLPRVYEATHTTGGAFYLDSVNAIVLPATDYRGMTQVFRHEYNHFMDVLGKCDKAAAKWRRLNQTGSTITHPGGYDYVKGKWGDVYTGRVYKHTGTEVNSTIAETLEQWRGGDMLRAYNANPEHLGHYLAQAKGSFLP